VAAKARGIGPWLEKATIRLERAHGTSSWERVVEFLDARRY
jgi:hypothetical protein